MNLNEFLPNLFSSAENHVSGLGRNEAKVKKMIEQNDCNVSLDWFRSANKKKNKQIFHVLLFQRLSNFPEANFLYNNNN